VAAKEQGIVTRYRIGQPIGSGGMAEVLEAWRTMPNGEERPMAIKRLLPEHGSDPDALMRFEREAQICLKLSCEHPNLVSVYDFDRTDEGALYMVMERVDGISLDRLLTAAPLAVPLVRAILRAIARALAYVHDHGVMHRDISPRNVLVARDGVVKLLDFGLARWLDAPRSNFGFKGTPAYASPEAFHRSAELDASSDLYSMAAVGYHLLTGKPPFGFGAAMHINRRMAAWDIAPLPDDVPNEFGDALMGLLQPYEQRRIKTAPEFLDALGEPCASTEALASLVEHTLASEQGAVIEARSLFSGKERLVPATHERATPARKEPARPARRARTMLALALMGLVGFMVCGYVLMDRAPASISQILTWEDNNPVVPSSPDSIPEPQQPEQAPEPERPGPDEPVLLVPDRSDAKPRRRSRRSRATARQASNSQDAGAIMDASAPVVEYVESAPVGSRPALVEPPESHGAKAPWQRTRAGEPVSGPAPWIKTAPKE
jgi:serine/threonine-protein kinase